MLKKIKSIDWLIDWKKWSIVRSSNRLLLKFSFVQTVNCDQHKTKSAQGCLINCNYTNVYLNKAKWRVMIFIHVQVAFLKDKINLIIVRQTLQVLCYDFYNDTQHVWRETASWLPKVVFNVKSQQCIKFYYSKWLIYFNDNELRDTNCDQTWERCKFWNSHVTINILR